MQRSAELFSLQKAGSPGFSSAFIESQTALVWRPFLYRLGVISPSFAHLLSPLILNDYEMLIGAFHGRLHAK